MALPLAAIIGLMAAGAAAKYGASRQRQDAYGDYAEAERQRQRGYQQDAEDAYAKQRAMFDQGQVEKDLDDSVREMRDALIANQRPAETPENIAPSGVGEETRKFEQGQRLVRRQAANQEADARARLGGLGDILFDRSLSGRRTSDALGSASQQARASMNTFQGPESTAAQQQGGGLDLLGDLFMTGASLGAGFPTAGGATGATSITQIPMNLRNIHTGTSLAPSWMMFPGV